jgi:hypothetical protein
MRTADIVAKHVGGAMRYRSLVILGTATIAAALAAGPCAAAQDTVDGAVLLRFEQATHEYVALHREAARDLPPLQISPDGLAIHQAIEARAAAIRRARADARIGDILTVDLGTIFRSRIRRAFELRGQAAAVVLAQMSEAGEEGQPPIVNGRFSWRSAVPTPPCVLAVLPALPEQLQYRFVGLDLVLLDIDANLIVDILPIAIEPGPGTAGGTARF